MNLTSFYERKYSYLQQLIQQAQLHSRPQDVAMYRLARNSLKYAEKYLFSESAIRLLLSLLPDKDAEALIDLPAQQIWIEFSEPVYAGASNPIGVRALFLAPMVSEQNLQGLNEYERAHINKALAWWLEGGKTVWELTVLTKDDGVKLHYFPPVWINGEGFHCLFGNECMYNKDYLARAGIKPEVTEKGPTVPVCTDCLTLAEQSEWLYAVAYALTQKHILDSAEEKRPQTVALPYHRRVPMPGKKKHYQDGTHTYHYITFDLTASVRPGIPEQPHEVQPKGSWLLIDPETVMYVTKSFASSKRLLDPARNPRWKFKREVTVKEFDKRVPMRIHTIKKLIATKYAST